MTNISSYRINGFEQIKAFYSWVFNNPDKVRPTHISLYLFLWNQANRANWVEWFKCPYDLAMQGACIGNNNTYYRCLDDLKKWKILDYQKGINNYKAPLINLIQLYDNEHLTEQVSVPLSEQQTAQQPVQLSAQQTAQQPVHIYKLITNNIELINKYFDKFEKFVLSLNDDEYEFSLHHRLRVLFMEWYLSAKGIKYTWAAKDANHLKQMIGKLIERASSKGYTPTNDTLITMFKKMLDYVKDESDKRERWLWDNLSISNLNSQYQQVLDRGIKNKETKK